MPFFATRKKLPRVLVGMSGGVDSSLSAALLCQQGYAVTGGFIKNWSDSKDVWTGECGWRGERRDALRVCAQLGIDLLTFDFETAYRTRVLERMFREYGQGITPNPDVLCNEAIKFGLFAERAFELGFDGVASGHYARVEHDEIGQAHLLKGADRDKDQTYFLHRISQAVLRRTLFPIGGLKKTDVREEAERRRLVTARKPDSQGICFVGKLDFHYFLRQRIPAQPGDIVTSEGTIIGRHDGLDAYTIGQRHGLQVSKDRRAWYVARKNQALNQLVVVADREDPLLYAREATAVNVHWIGGKPGEPGVLFCQVAIRYRQAPESACLKLSGERVHIVFDRPVWALAPGQSAVFYQGDECLGGGFLAA